MCKVTAIHAHIIFIATAVQEVEETIDLIKLRTQFFTRKQRKHKQRFNYTTPLPLHLGLRTVAEETL